MNAGLDNFKLSNGSRIVEEKPWQRKNYRAWRPEPVGALDEKQEKARVMAARERAETADFWTGQSPNRKNKW